MASSIIAKFVTQINGSTRQGKISPASINFMLPNQDAHNQLSVVVEPGDVLKPIAMPIQQGGSGTAQTFFLISTDENVQIRLNGVAALTYNILKDGFFGFSGQPEVTLIEFTSIESSDANVFVSKIMGLPALPIPPGGGAGSPAGGLRLEDIGPAGVSQTAFALPSTPSNPNAAVLFADGVEYSSPTFFTISGSTLTWLDVAFTFSGGERVEILYQ